MLDRKRVEKGLNVALGIFIVIVGGIALKRFATDNYVPKGFEQPEEHAAPLYKVKEHVDDGAKAFKDGPPVVTEDDEPLKPGEGQAAEWLAGHFQFKQPIPAQGEPPEGWTEIESSLSPQACGTCHPQQLSQWNESWHHLGMGPGMMGQLVDAEDSFVHACQRCHAPNAEQYPKLDGEENPAYMAELRTEGLTCAGCHVRDWDRYGPPTEGHPQGSEIDPEQAATAEATEPLVDPNEGLPHGGFIARDEFQDPLFCEGCHDGRIAAGKQLEEKKIQETYQEWRRTEFAGDGVTCQSCHMPEGDHSFKGIHDREFTQGAFEATAELSSLGDGMVAKPLEATLTITNTGAGHRFPTYTTPRVVLVIEQLDAGGTPIEGTRQQMFVARALTPNLQTELYDTRILPGESQSLEYSAARHEQCAKISARVEVWPDEAYRKNYEIWIKNETYPAEGLKLLEEAMQAATDSRYVAWERAVDLSEQ